MIKTVRLNKTERNNLHEKVTSINKTLVEMGKLPIKESELIHIILEKSIKNIELDAVGNYIMKQNE